MPTSANTPITVTLELFELAFLTAAVVQRLDTISDRDGSNQPIAKAGRRMEFDALLSAMTKLVKQAS
jgi:hypothetical protein